MRQSVSDNYGSTTLSSYIKSLRASNVPFDINWECEERGAPFNVITGWCRLCTLEKLHILSNPEGASLNQRSEFFSHCFHKDPQLLINRKLLWKSQWHPAHSVLVFLPHLKIPFKSSSNLWYVMFYYAKVPHSFCFRRETDATSLHLFRNRFVKPFLGSNMR